MIRVGALPYTLDVGDISSLHIYLQNYLNHLVSLALSGLIIVDALTVDDN